MHVSFVVTCRVYRVFLGHLIVYDHVVLQHFSCVDKRNHRISFSFSYDSE